MKALYTLIGMLVAGWVMRDVFRHAVISLHAQTFWERALVAAVAFGIGLGIYAAIVEWSQGALAWLRSRRAQ